ncbi:alpha/beta fold hydrolase [Methanocella arvoryzae]|uniref:Hydrolase (Alpha/beta fold family) n=1 Tax=Methanocella arvoryzae (strain DSM 22066 / NBRC 105507 / MRE50) TaxID=351160 RepID=Q0W2A8_METAR|nr:alpha/beta hydrolase [Methanocella arvoryzae]CAJ37485.1 hydrolase (alpha/beta fold family) [Methanocella arvoryzae MRE50]
MFQRIGNVDVYYEVVGEGKPVLMIHGYGLDHYVMSGCLEPIFTGRPGYRRIYFDLPGMGQTKASRTIDNSDRMVELIVRFLEQVIPEGTFLVAGESYGGYLARALILHMPERIDGVLLICPLVVPERHKRRLPPRIVIVKDEALLNSLSRGERDHFESMATVLDEYTWTRFKQDIMPGISLEDTNFTEGFQKYGYPLSYDVDDHPPFEKPFLLLAGRQDISVGYQDHLMLVENYPRGTFAILDRAGHSLQIEQAAVFNVLVEEWLDRVEEKAR